MADETAGTVQKLFEEIKRSVAAQDFVKAEALREELLQADTMALKEIIESAELIEAAKLTGIDQNHQLIWKNLYERLTPEEISVFYYCLINKNVPAKTVLTRQGSISNRLFLVDEGRLAAVFQKGDKNYMVLQVGKGGFIGEDTFFGMSICTATVVTQSEAKLRILEKSSILEWAEKAPGLYVKLESFFNENGQYEEAYERKRLEESRFDRLSVKGWARAEILTSKMEKSGKQFKAAIGDLSRGGTCLFIKSSNKEAARGLLGRPLEIVFTLEGNTGPVKFLTRGKIIKIKFHLQNDYSVHVQFGKNIEQEKIELLQVTE